jgi:hypothetical protein
VGSGQHMQRIDKWKLKESLALNYHELGEGLLARHSTPAKLHVINFR